MTGLGINEAVLLNCSAIIKNIIAEQGLLAGWPLIKQQFANCHLAYQTLETEREKRERQKRQRRRQGQQRQCLSKKIKRDVIARPILAIVFLTYLVMA